MLLKIKYEDVKASGVRGEVNGKAVNFFMRIQVDELNIVEALEKFRGNKWVVSFDYIGEVGFLRTIDIGSNNVIVTKEIDKIDINVDFIMGEIDNRVRVVFNLPDSYSDMRIIYDYSQKYKNIRFDGGRFIRLDGCSIGSIGISDIPKKIAESRLAVATEGNASIFANITIDDVDILEFYDSKSSVSGGKKASGGSKTKKPKKQLSSLLSLVNSEGFNNF
jgi:hypothetical protein